MDRDTDLRDTDEIDSSEHPRTPTGEMVPCIYNGPFSRCQVCGAGKAEGEAEGVVIATAYLPQTDERGWVAHRPGATLGNSHVHPTREGAIAALRVAEERVKRELEDSFEWRSRNVGGSVRGLLSLVADGDWRIERPDAKPDMPRYSDGSEVRVGDTVRFKDGSAWYVVDVRPDRPKMPIDVVSLGDHDGVWPGRASQNTPIRDPAELAATLRAGDQVHPKGVGLVYRCAGHPDKWDLNERVSRLRDGWRIVRRETLANRGE